jgi:hypothetical protein
LEFEHIVIQEVELSPSTFATTDVNATIPATDIGFGFEEAPIVPVTMSNDYGNIQGKNFEEQKLGISLR